jgi:uncharacterized phage protein (TIGR01671 family)
MKIKYRIWDDISKKMHSYEEIKHIAIEKFELDHYTIMLYVGIDDMNGKEIYEEDIVERINTEHVEGFSGVVHYEAPYFTTRNNDSEEIYDNDVLDYQSKVIKVIGNIFENK